MSQVDECGVLKTGPGAVSQANKSQAGGGLLTQTGPGAMSQLDPMCGGMLNKPGPGATSQGNQLGLQGTSQAPAENQPGGIMSP